MTTDDELESKLARLGGRVQAQAGTVRKHIAECAGMDVADAFRETFQGKCSYYGPLKPSLYGHPYNFDLKANHASANPLDRSAPSTSERPANLPYRGKASTRKRPGRRSQTADRRSDPKPTWHDLQGDR